MNILKIDLVLQSVTNGIISVWDIINDIFLAAIVDKTRTKWGKFRPWLLIGTVLNALFSLINLNLPVFDFLLESNQKKLYTVFRKNIYRRIPCRI